ncbi:ATPase, T2SS/T4P/T4SS family [Desulfovibrio ferrophilus]|nr:ATPase, T2SS/T4P/T4SS family [Desulfovibrio ferrophilus]
MAAPNKIRYPLLAEHAKPIEKYFKPGVVELCINGPGEIFIETHDGWKRKADKELSAPLLNKFASVLASVQGQKYDPNVHPLLSTSLPGYGYRVQICGGALVTSGFAMSVRIAQARRFPLESYSVSKGPKMKIWEEEIRDALRDERIDDGKVIEKIKDGLVQGRSILVVGGTSSGKTALLNSMAVYVPQDQRILTIEDTAELDIDNPNKVSFLKSKTGTDVAQITDTNILDACLRMRPDRMYMGELDIKNTMYFLRMVNTGHCGALATLHANGSDGAIDAMAQNCALCKYDAEAAKQYARKGIALIVVIQQRSRRDYNLQAYDLTV